MKEFDLYDIGDLKDDPVRLYNMAVCFRQFFECRTDDQTAEIWQVLSKVEKSLWCNLPPVVTIDFTPAD